MSVPAKNAGPDAGNDRRDWPAGVAKYGQSGRAEGQLFRLFGSTNAGRQVLDLSEQYRIPAMAQQESLGGCSQDVARNHNGRSLFLSLE